VVHDFLFFAFITWSFKLTNINKIGSLHFYHLTIFGAGGHAKVVIDMIEKADEYVIAGILFCSLWYSSESHKKAEGWRAVSLK
jgi:hypothetical protein